MAPIKCWFCKKLGHKKVNCWSAHPEKNPHLNAAEPSNAARRHASKPSDDKKVATVPQEASNGPTVLKSTRMEEFEKQFQKHLKLCSSPKKKPSRIDPSLCFFLNVLNSDTRKVFYRHLFSRPEFNFRYHLWDLTTFLCKQLKEAFSIGFNYPYSCNILSTCKTVYEESLRLYFAHTRLLLLGEPTSIVPKKLIRELCREVLVRDNIVERNFGQFKNLQRIVVGGNQCLVNLVEHDTVQQESRMTEKYMLEKWQAGAQQFLANMEAVKHKTGAKVIIEALLTCRSPETLKRMYFEFETDSMASYIRDFRRNG